METTVAGVNAKRETLAERYEEMVNRLTEIKGKMSTLKTQIKSATEAVISKLADISLAETSAEEAVKNGDKSGLDAAIKAAKDIVADIEASDTAIKPLETEFETAKIEIGRVNAQVDEALVSSLNASIQEIILEVKTALTDSDNAVKSAKGTLATMEDWTLVQ